MTNDLPVSIFVCKFRTVRSSHGWSPLKRFCCSCILSQNRTQMKICLQFHCFQALIYFNGMCLTQVSRGHVKTEDNEQLRTSVCGQLCQLQPAVTCKLLGCDNIHWEWCHNSGCGALHCSHFWYTAMRVCKDWRDHQSHRQGWTDLPE